MRSLWWASVFQYITQLVGSRGLGKAWLAKIEPSNVYRIASLVTFYENDRQPELLCRVVNVAY